MREAILDATYSLWHDGLSRRRYGQYNEAQLRTRWGAARLVRLALVDGSELLSTAKRYDLLLRVDGADVPAIGIGALFTPPARRGHGYAAELVERMCADASAEGTALAVLFSEIGPRYYERLGFHVVPVREVDVAIRPAAGAPAVLVRAGEDRDLPALADMQARLAGRYRFALRYDADWLQYSIAKKRLLAGLTSQGSREVEFFVAEEGAQAVAWVLLHVTGRDRSGYTEAWSLEACGDRDPAGARIGAMLQALVARSPAVRSPVIRAWWPAALSPPQLAFAARPEPVIALMVRPLTAGTASALPLGADEVLYWHGDAF